MNYNRRKFIKHLALFGGVLTAGRMIPSPFGSAAARPLEMLVLGDSVMWGQGLREENKFSTLVGEWLKTKSGREVNIHREAHSGATIYPETNDGRQWHGEINISSPSIMLQVKNAVKNYKSRDALRGGAISPDAVDLILVNGGINDMNGVNILFSSRKKITKKAEEYCYRGMSKLLGEIMQTYPNARIVANGYFPLVSLKSPQSEVWEVFSALLGENPFKDLSDNVVRYIMKKIPGRFHFAHNLLAARSDRWFEENNRQMKRAVDDVNKADKSSAFSEENPRVLFVRAPFADINCYAVEETSFLWKIVAKLRADDEMTDLRKNACEDAPVNKLLCNRAGAFHPNKKGAKAYAGAIETELEKIFEKTGWKT